MARPPILARAISNSGRWRRVATTVAGRWRQRLRTLVHRGRPDAADETRAPHLGADEKQALLALARRVVIHHVGGTPTGTAPVAPPGLLRRTDGVFVTFWVNGAMRGCQGASGGTLLHDTVTATKRTLVDDRVPPLTADELVRLQIEIDVLGPASPFRARRLTHFRKLIEPGIHGIVAEQEGRRAVFKSSVAITRNWSIDDLIPQLCRKGGWPADAYRRRGIRFARFRSTSFIGGEGDCPVWDLLRANRLVSARDWSPGRIAGAVRDGADYLVRAQRCDGGFAYQYAPADGQYAVGDNLVRQVATVWIMLELARRFPDSRYREAAADGLGFLAAKTQTGPQGALVADDPAAASLGATALGLLALATAVDEGSLGQGRRLADAILSLQQNDGRFLTHFPPSRRIDGQDFYPGEAMLALMHFHARYPDPRYPEALRRAFPYYRRYFRSEPSAAFAPWQMAAYAELFRLTREREYADFVFELADWLLPRQYTAVNAPYPDYVGGYAMGRVPGIGSATCNEGVLDAYDLARELAHRERAALYQRAALTAVLFTLRLQFTRPNTFFVPQAERVWGGFRTSLADSTMRIDHTVHALNSLLKAERYFWAGRGRTEGGDRDREPAQHPAADDTMSHQEA